MKKKFTLNLILLLVLNILVKPVWIFGIDRNVQNIVGAADYGMYYALFNLSLILNIILDIGITNYNNREISRHPNMLVRYMSNVVGLKFLLSVVYAVVVVAVALAMGYKPWQVPLLLLLIVNQFLASFIQYIRSNLNALQYFATDSFLSILDKLLMIIICGIIIWGDFGFAQISINVFVVTQTISYVIVLLVAVLIMLKKGGRFTFTINKITSIAILKQSYLYATLVLLMFTFGRMDILMVERLLPNGDENAGIYAQAFRLVDAYNMFPFMVASLLLPIFSRMIKERQQLSSFVQYSFEIMIVPVLAISIPTIFFREPIMTLLYSAHTDQSSDVLGILMLSFIFISVNYVFGTLLTAQGAIKVLNKISLVLVVLSVILQLVLVKMYGLIGAAVGNLCVNALNAIIEQIYAIKILNIEFRQKTVVRYIIYIGASVLLVAFFKSISMNWTMFFVSALAIVLLAFLMQILKINELIKFLKDY